ncbi:hypothetical protein FORC48_3642 [Bacillus cereus]|uniref:hypothetical protein n=1 Tax=Bacillus cereus TaxID=1396 RepID=UPI000B5A0CED|nr:hypothetical protein [Bacillus cereus]ASI84722.1 hypothetical protein FORC48_3642 [Bacillus cereus]
MGIREWFGYKGETVFSTQSDEYLDKLLGVYVRAFKQYFSVEDAQNINELLHIVKQRPNIDTEQALFLEWVEEDGLQIISKYITKTIPKNEQLIAQLEYEIYILESEMDFEYPEDVISSIINTTNLFSEMIDPTLETSASVLDTAITFYEYILDDNISKLSGDVSWLTESQDSKDESGSFYFSITSSSKDRPEFNKNPLYSASYFLGEGVYLNGYKKESANKADSFFDVYGYGGIV